MLQVWILVRTQEKRRGSSLSQLCCIQVCGHVELGVCVLFKHFISKVVQNDT